ASAPPSPSLPSVGPPSAEPPPPHAASERAKRTAKRRIASMVARDAFRYRRGVPIPRELVQTPAGRDVAGLALSCVDVDAPMAGGRAAHWRTALAKVGVAAPFSAVHDIGLLTVLPPGGTPIAPRPFAKQLGGLVPLLEQWSDVLREIAASEMVEKARAWRLS